MYKRKYARKRYPQRKRKTYRKKSYLYKKIAKIAKKVSLRNAETKHVYRSIGTNWSVGHNAWLRPSSNLIHILRGVEDGSIQSRIGDSVILRGVKLMMNIESFATHPRATFRVLVVKLRKQYADLVVPPTKVILNNSVLDPVDMEQVKQVIMDRKFTVKYQSNIRSAEDQNNDPPINDVIIGSVSAPIMKKFWIPFKNWKYTFSDNSPDTGRDYNVAIYVTAWNDRNTAASDTCGIAAFGTELYFKDP